MDHTEDMMDQGVSGALPQAAGLSQAEPEVSALRASIPNAVIAHFTRMMEAAANYLEPTTYIARHPVDKGIGLCKWNTEFPMPEPTHAPEAVKSINDRRDQAFINDMIYMLDGPEQRAALASGQVEGSLIAALKQIATMQDGEQAWWARDIANAALTTAEGR